MDDLDGYFAGQPSDSELQFCTPETVARSLEYVNHAVMSYGVSRPLSLPGLDVDAAVDILNAMNSLIQQKQEDSQLVRELEDRAQKQYNASELLKSRLANVQARAQDAEKKVDDLTARLGLSEVEARSLEKALADSRREARRSADALSSHQALRAVEIKRMDRDAKKLKESLNKSITDRTGKAVAIKTLNPVPVSRVSITGRPTPTPAQTEEELVKRLAHTYEQRASEIAQENLALRQLLARTYTQLEDTLGVVSPSSSESRDAESGLTVPGGSLTAIHTRMPLDLSRAALEARWSRLLERADRSLRGVSSLSVDPDASLIDSPPADDASEAMLMLQEKVRLLEKQLGEERARVAADDGERQTAHEILQVDLEMARTEHETERAELLSRLAERDARLEAHEIALERLRGQIHMSPAHVPDAMRALQKRCEEYRAMLDEHEEAISARLTAQAEAFALIETPGVAMTTVQLRELERELREERAVLAAQKKEFEKRVKEFNSKILADAFEQSERTAKDAPAWMLETPARVHGGAVPVTPLETPMRRTSNLAATPVNASDFSDQSF